MTNKALISPNEEIFDYSNPPQMLGYRVAQIVADGEEFPVAEPLYWVDVADDVTCNHYYDGTSFAACPVNPNSQTPLTQIQELQAQLAALTEQINSITQGTNNNGS